MAHLIDNRTARLWDAARAGEIGPGDQEYDELNRALAAYRDDQPAQPPAPAPAPRTVYYIRRHDGAIKIGSTQAAAGVRLDQLARAYGALTLLAQEHGPCGLETERHDLFGHARLPRDPRPGGTEWFRPTADLLAHVEALGGVAA